MFGGSQESNHALISYSKFLTNSYNSSYAYYVANDSVILISNQTTTTKNHNNE